MEVDKIVEKIEALLSTAPKSARDFLRALKTDGSLSEDGKKKAVNSALYKLLKEGKAVKTDGTPPFWTKPVVTKSNSGSEDESSEEMITAVFIDINSACHNQAIKYASQTVPIYIIANSDFPAELPKSSTNVNVVTVSEGENVNTEIVVRATTFVCAMHAVNRPAKVLIVSSASMMNGIDRMLKTTSSKIEVEIVKDGWETLKLSLE